MVKAYAQKDVDRRFGRISGTLAFVNIAVFVKFGLWQALTERCCGTVETAGVGTADGVMLAEAVADAAGAAILGGHFRGRLEGFRRRWFSSRTWCGR